MGWSPFCSRAIDATTGHPSSSGGAPLDGSRELDVNGIDFLTAGIPQQQRRVARREPAPLSASECALLTKTKLEGFEAKEIANTDGEMSSIAVHHRLQGIMAQLRDTATLVPDDNRACAKRIIRKLPPEQSVAAPTSVGVGRERSKIIQNNAVNFFWVNFRPVLPISSK
jgi:hypothetical protein